jgi:carbon monoxide dehydrogenase subunit G
VKLSFEGLAQIVERAEDGRGLRLVGQGRDTGGSATQADIRLLVEAGPDGGTVLRADADLFLSGRIAQFGRALAGDVSRRLFEQFAAAVDESARTGAAPDGLAAAPPSPLRIAAGVVADAVRRRVRALGARLRRR